MSAWTWVLIGLCAAGALLALAQIIPVLRLALRLRSRVQGLQNARLFTSMESLALQSKRLEHLARQAAPLALRAQDAVAQIRASSEAAGYTGMRHAMQDAGAEISSLLEALR